MTAGKILIPPFLQHLQVDMRGYPVPWFVAWRERKFVCMLYASHECPCIFATVGTPEADAVSGGGNHCLESKSETEPEFRAMDPVKLRAAINQSLCWVCGKKLGVYKTFVVGPMCGINRISSEPPSHLKCAEWSAVNCPFLNNPRMVRREDEEINNAHLVANSAGVAITRNPGVTLLWTTRGYDLVPDHRGNGFLFMMGDPTQVLFYREGRRATRAEIEHSVRTGLPALQTMARQDGVASVKQLNAMVEKFEELLPAEVV